MNISTKMIAPRNPMTPKVAQNPPPTPNVNVANITKVPTSAMKKKIAINTGLRVTEP